MQKVNDGNEVIVEMQFANLVEMTLDEIGEGGSTAKPLVQLDAKLVIGAGFEDAGQPAQKFISQEEEEKGDPI